jgi:tRNA pseudouridine55 synthase
VDEAKKTFFAMDGIISVRKPPQITSHDVVKRIRSLLDQPKVGHFGTLDPMATGLLLVAVGAGTRLFPFFSKLDKTYTGEIRLGFATDTYDATGIEASSHRTPIPEKKRIIKAMQGFLGDQLQLPPPFSAKKYKGRPLYRLARAAQPTPLSPSRITVYVFSLDSYQSPTIRFTVRCSTGTYIRSLAHDLGQVLGCGAHLTQLERTQVGRFSLGDSHTLDEIRDMEQSGQVQEFLIPLEQLLPEFPKLILTSAGSELARNGNLVLPAHISRLVDSDSPSASTSGLEAIHFRLFSREGQFLAIARKSREGNALHPFLVIDRATSSE